VRFRSAAAIRIDSGLQCPSGKVIGLFSRATGNGPRSAFEHGHLWRVFVCSTLAIDGLARGHRCYR
jgi:hypothetical protein